MHTFLHPTHITKYMYYSPSGLVLFFFAPFVVAAAKMEGRNSQFRGVWSRSNCQRHLMSMEAVKNNLGKVSEFALDFSF